MRDQMRITTAVFGYCDRFDHRPGATVTVLLHSERPTTAEIDLVRLRNAFGVSFAEAVAGGGSRVLAPVAPEGAVSRNPD